MTVDERAIGSRTESTGSRSQPTGSVTDKVCLRGISGFGNHGVFDFERENGQRFVVDVTCWLDLGRAAASDDLTDTLDYGTLAQAIVADIEGPPLNLIEALAGRIADSCLSSPLVESVEVTVHKPEAPIDVITAAKRHAEVADVAVTLTRSRTRD